MTKGKSDRGVRTKESGVDEDILVTDQLAGDEGIDDSLAGKPFKPGRPEHFVKDAVILPAENLMDSHDIAPNRLGRDRDEGLVEDPPSETASPPGPTFKQKPTGG